MEPMRHVVVDNGCRNVVDLDKRQVFNFVLPIETGNHSDFSKLGNRKRKNECKTDTKLNSSSFLLKNCSNFMKSHLPKRILFHQNGEWNDFPNGLVELVRDDFLMKKTVIKVHFNGVNIMLDFLYMVQVDPVTGSQGPIAWIDEAGSCYFPELCSLNVQTHRCCQSRVDRERVSHGADSSGAHEIKLHIDVDLNGLNNPNLEECVEESNVGTKRPKFEQVSVKNDGAFLDKGKSICKREAKPLNGIGDDGYRQLEPAYQLLDANVIQNLFHVAMKLFADVRIVQASKCSSNSLPMRLELFEKQVEITSRRRGNANVQYAWFPCSIDTLSSIYTYGLWHGGNEVRTKCGNGVYLNAVNSAFASARNHDFDENEVHYVLFCRVILGNVEVLHPGSMQFHPSNEEFDSGVDHIENPSCYIIWNMNASTHIFPEYVLSFKMSSSAEGAEVREDKKFNISGVTCREVQCQLQGPYQMSQNGAGGTMGSSSRTPKSPAMRFTSLFEALMGQVSAKDMNLVYTQYELFRCKEISRDEFIMKLRLIVGDQLLKSSIMNLQGKMPSNNDGPLEAQAEAQEGQD